MSCVCTAFDESLIDTPNCSQAGKWVQTCGDYGVIGYQLVLSQKPLWAASTLRLRLLLKQPDSKLASALHSATAKGAALLSIIPPQPWLRP